MSKVAFYFNCKQNHLEQQDKYAICKVKNKNPKLQFNNNKKCRPVIKHQNIVMLPHILHNYKVDEVLDKKRLLELEGIKVGKELNQTIPAIVETNNTYVRDVINHWDRHFHERELKII